MLKTAIALLLATGLTGCATALNRTTEKVPVYSDPGASISYDGTEVGRTTAEVSVKRGSPGVIAVTSDRCPTPYRTTPERDMAGAIWLNVFLGPVGLVGAVVDVASGAMWNVKPERISAFCLQGNWIGDGNIVEGMTDDQVRAAWGDPLSVNSTLAGGVSSEQWVYGSGYYVYFEDGIVTGIQTSR